jgi:predicted MFS family arabinose efflux permease
MQFGWEQSAGKPWFLYSARQRWTFLAILFLVGTSSSLDKIIISVLLEPIKHEFHASDTELGLLGGLSFAVFYSVLGVPIARFADRGNRRTLIALAVALWSIMTALCGAAGSFVLLLLTRVGVSVGEAGSTPPAQSLIADYFAPDRRARAIGVFTTSGTVGYLLGVALGSQIVAAYGWRQTFVILGLPGLLIAAAALLFLREPRADSRLKRQESIEQESFLQSAAILLRKPSFVRLLGAHTVYAFAVYGALLFVPSYLTRVLGYPIATAGYYFGITSAFAVFAGSIAGGILSDWMVRRDRRWLVWFPGAVFILAGIPNSGMFLIDRLPAFLAVSTLGMLLLNASLPAAFSAVHAVCGARRRATAIALILFLVNSIGFGLGPLLTGAMSDMFTARYGVAGLRYALFVVMLLIPVAGLLLLSAARSVREDCED